MKRPALSARAATAASAWSLAVVLTLFAALVFTTNHCELGALAKAASAGSSCCAKPAAPDSAPAGCRHAECCAPHAAPVPLVASAPPAAWTLALPVFTADRSEISLPPVRGTTALARAHAPPGGIRFLQVLGFRSAPAHGPPAGVA